MVDFGDVIVSKKLLHRRAAAVTLTERFKETNGLKLVAGWVVFGESDEDRKIGTTRAETWCRGDCSA